jgi:hypothetical protein
MEFGQVSHRAQAGIQKQGLRAPCVAGQNISAEEKTPTLKASSTKFQDQH